MGSKRNSIGQRFESFHSSLSHREKFYFFTFPHMKSSTFLPTFIRYSFNAMIALWIFYILADYHINQLPWFSLQEWFMIAGEALVFCAFILAFKDTRPTLVDMLQDSLDSFWHFIDEHKDQEIKSLKEKNDILREKIADDSKKIQKYQMFELEVQWKKFSKKTTKWIPLSEEHKKKISESLKKKNAEKKAQAERIQKTATASQKRKAANK